MDVMIWNCNSINEAKITIQENRLNIKYGINGTGKSTVVKAIELATANSTGGLSELKPFKYFDQPEDEKNNPLIEGLDSIQSVLTFNEDYVNQFVFKQDEVVENSFEIFIKTKEYDQKMEAIETLVSDIKETFKSDERLEQVITDLRDLYDSFGKAKSGYSAAGRIGKAVGKGNKLENIPETLIPYTPFLQNSQNVQWINWQIKGNQFLDVANDCPYCTSPTEGKKEQILSVSREFDAKSIEHLNKLLETLERLGNYFHPDTNKRIHEIVRNKDGLEKAEINYLVEVKNQIEVLIESLLSLKDISYYSLKEDDKVQNKITSLKINLDLLSHLNSENTSNIVENINHSLDEVVKNIGKLQGQINLQKNVIQKTIQKYNQEINDFLKYAGYDYFVDIEEEENSYKMRLKHRDFSSNIENSSKHLSFGEKNAFSLVLFMYECLSKQPGLIVLDDPISSFDKNKKFAIIEMLFRRQGSFKGKTVLMMTHDFEPIVDMLSTLKAKFQPLPCASFLCNKNGLLSEINIEKDDILSFGQVCKDNIQSSKQDIIKLVYLRRYYEILDNKGDEYHVISSLFHKRTKPSYDTQGSNLIPDSQLKPAVSNIKEDIPNFDYETILGLINDRENMISIYNSTDNNYEKLQIFRIIYADTQHENSVIQKFINETFHIENEYVMQLNPSKYDFIPQYIINECDGKITA